MPQVAMQAATAVASVTAIASPTSVPQVTETTPPIATMLRTMIPGTQAPTRVYEVETPQEEPTRGLGDPNLKSAADTRVAENQSEWRTAWALTPTSTPGSPTATYTPAPTATEILGWLDCGGDVNTYVIQHESCWQLMFNGHLLLVRSGREGYGSDMGQGLIEISQLGSDDRFHGIGTYLTPSRQGSVEMASMDGSRVYLVQSTAREPRNIDVTPVPSFVFIFDLATDMWLDAAGTPIPTTPLPTDTPEPTSNPLP